MNKPNYHPIKFSNQHLDQDALKIIRRLSRHGYEAYLVGGCVRDLLFGLRPKDFDLVTSATPEEIRKVFRNCRIIGRRFRLAHIYFADRKIIEVATYRDQAEPVPPKDVSDIADSAEENNSDSLLIRNDNTFGNAETDAMRRDFTINGLLYDPEKEQVIDYVGGWEDLQERKLVSLGDPQVRFQEDPVRIIRAAKFMARMDLDCDPQVWQAMIDWHVELEKTSPSRVSEEIYKILAMQHGVVQTFKNLREVGALPCVLPFLLKSLERFRAKEEDENEFWSYLDTLDRWNAKEIDPDYLPFPKTLKAPSRALLFSLLIIPSMKEDLKVLRERKVSPEFRIHLQDRIQDFAMELRNPRKDTLGTKQIIFALNRLYRGVTPQEESKDGHKKTSRKGRRRGVSPKVLAGRGYFLEALHLMWFLSVAEKDLESLEKVREWMKWEDFALECQRAQNPKSKGKKGRSKYRNNRRRRAARKKKPSN